MIEANGASFFELCLSVSLWMSSDIRANIPAVETSPKDAAIGVAILSGFTENLLENTMIKAMIKPEIIR